MTEREHRPTVLLAEDNEDLRLVMAIGLRGDGNDVTEVATGRALMKAVQSAMNAGDAPSVIVSDIKMPGMSGLRALANLRSEGCKVPVLLVTGHGDESARRAARELGVEAFLTKPFDLVELRALVSKLARRHDGLPDR